MNDEDQRLIQDVLADGRMYFGADADREFARTFNEMADRRGRVDNTGHAVIDGTVTAQAWEPFIVRHPNA